MVKGGTSRGLQVPLLLSTPRAPLCVLAPPPLRQGLGSVEATTRVPASVGGQVVVFWSFSQQRRDGRR